MVQLLVEEVTGKAFDAVAKEQIFEVLHLKNTFFGTREAIDAYEKKGNMATGYLEDGTAVEGRNLRGNDQSESGRAAGGVRSRVDGG